MRCPFPHSYLRCLTSTCATRLHHLQLVLNWTSDSGSEPPPIRNKVAQLLVSIFTNEFPDAWPSFFDDLLSLLDPESPSTFDFFFRVLLTIDENVVDRNMARSPVSVVRVTRCRARDAMPCA
jgi:hypothetical protein